MSNAARVETVTIVPGTQRAVNLQARDAGFPDWAALAAAINRARVAAGQQPLDPGRIQPGTYPIQRETTTPTNPPGNPPGNPPAPASHQQSQLWTAPTQRLTNAQRNALYRHQQDSWRQYLIENGLDQGLEWGNRRGYMRGSANKGKNQQHIFVNGQWMRLPSAADEMDPTFVAPEAFQFTDPQFSANRWGEQYDTEQMGDDWENPNEIMTMQQWLDQQYGGVAGEDSDDEGVSTGIRYNTATPKNERERRRWENEYNEWVQQQRKESWDTHRSANRADALEAAEREWGTDEAIAQRRNQAAWEQHQARERRILEENAQRQQAYYRQPAFHRTRNFIGNVLSDEELKEKKAPEHIISALHRRF